MKNLQLLLALFLVLSSFQDFADASTLEKTKPLPSLAIDEKVARVQAMYEDLLEKFKFTEAEKILFYEEADTPFRLIVKTRFLLKKRKDSPNGLSYDERLDCILSLMNDHISSHEKLCQVNNLLPSDLDKNLDILLEEIENAPQPTTWYDRFHSFYSVLAILVISLLVISVLTWQFYKKSSAEDL